MTEPTQPTPAASAAPVVPAGTVVAPPPGAFPGAPAGTYPPGSYPAAYPAPAAAQWGQPAAPAPPAGNKRKPAVIIGAAVAGIAVIGGVFAVVNASRDKKDNTVADGGQIIGGPTPTINPDDGPAPAPPAPPATVPGPTTPPSVVTTTVPPPTTAPPTTTAPTPPPSGDTQTVLGQISVAVPSGWSVLNSDEGFVVLGADDGGAQYFINALQFDGDAQTLTSDYLQNATIPYLEDYQVLGEQAADLPTSSVVSAYILAYQGVLATQQGSVPVEGTVITYITQSGIGVVTETFNAVGDFQNYLAAYDEMINSIINTL